MEGDPKYLAPECLLNVYTPAADVFSLGMLMLEIATDLYLPPSGPQWHHLRNGDLPASLHEKGQCLSLSKVRARPADGHDL